MQRNAIISIGATLAAWLCTCPVRAAHYTVIDLGTLGGEWSRAYGVNEAGRAVGHSLLSSGSAHHAFLYSDQPHDLGTVAGKLLSQGFDADASDRVVGAAYDLGDLDPRAFRAQGATVENLGAFAARATTADGAVVIGTALIDDGVWKAERAARWTDSGLEMLPTLGGDNSTALDVDASGRIVGSSFLSGERQNRACLWVGTTAIELGTLGGSWSQAHAISAQGVIVGISATSDGAPHAFRAQLDAQNVPGPLADLGVVSGSDSAAYDVNALGQIVGVSNGRAAIWQDGSPADLNSLIPANAGWELQSAQAISDAGLIAGSGLHQGTLRGYLLVPTCDADIDGDGSVNFNDLNIVLTFFATEVEPGTSGDVNFDGVVDFTDLNVLLSAFGQAC